MNNEVETKSQRRRIILMIMATAGFLFWAGGLVFLLASGIVFAISLFKPMSGIDAAHLILVIAVVSPMFAFVVLERPGA